MQFDFNAAYEKADKEFGLEKGQYFKPQEGANRVRLVSICLPHDSMYQGKPQFKWLCQVLDRADGKVKPYFMPNTIYRFIADLQLSDDYRFDSIPMPFDVVINAKGAGTKEVKYSLIPGKEAPLTAEEQALIKEAPTVQELQQRIRENDLKKEETDNHVSAPEPEITVRENPMEIGKEFIGEPDVSDVPF